MRYLEKEIYVKYPAGAKRDGYQPALGCYLQNRSEDLLYSRKRPAVIVCPGGCYSYNPTGRGGTGGHALSGGGHAGFCAAVLHRSLKYPCALLELAAAVAVIRENSEAVERRSGKDLYLL